MDAIIVALFFCFTMSKAWEFLEKRFDQTLTLLEDQNAETLDGMDERICIL